jgi:hypothetical protein
VSAALKNLKGLAPYWHGWNRGTVMTRTTAILLMCLWLCACGQGEQTKATKPDTAQELLAPLSTDPTLAEAELEKRLDASVKVSEGLVIVHDPFLGSLGSSILPATSPWVLTCGIGVSVILGSAISGDEGTVGNDVEVMLSSDVLEQNICDVVGPTLGKHLQTMLHSGSASH